MKTLLARIALRFLRWAGADVYVVTEGVKALLPDAKRACEKVEAIRDYVSSEYKHSHAFAQLCKWRPEAKKRDVGMAIELALR